MAFLVLTVIERFFRPLAPSVFMERVLEVFKKEIK